jgi:hypothetical protein
MAGAYPTEDPGTGLKIHTAPPTPSPYINPSVYRDLGKNIFVNGDIQIDMHSGYFLHLKAGCLIVSSIHSPSSADA